MDNKLFPLAMLLTRRDCSRILKYDPIVDLFAHEKARRKLFPLLIFLLINRLIENLSVYNECMQ